MNENMSPAAAVVMERAKYFAQFLGHNMIGPEHILAGYMAIEEPHRMVDVHLNSSAVLAQILRRSSFGGSNVRVDAVSVPLSLDVEAREVVQFAEQAADNDNHRAVLPSDLMAGVLQDPQSDATRIIVGICRVGPDKLLEQLQALKV